MTSFGLHYGIGFFEGVRSYETEYGPAIFRLQDHLRRLVRSAATYLVRLPYDKNGRYCWMPQIARHFTDRSYAFLVQDVRGKFRSEGEVNAFVHEIDDGYDTLEWITAQPWSDGGVGMFGDSYYGFTQWAAAREQPPHLKALMPAITWSEIRPPSQLSRTCGECGPA